MLRRKHSLFQSDSNEPFKQFILEFVSGTGKNRKASFVYCFILILIALLLVQQFFCISSPLFWPVLHSKCHRNAIDLEIMLIFRNISSENLMYFLIIASHKIRNDSFYRNKSNNIKASKSIEEYTNRMRGDGEVKFSVYIFEM